MAIAKMTKIMIASHSSEVADLLESLQGEGIVQVLDAERAMVSKEWPELQVESKRPRNIEEMVTRLDSSIKFLKSYATEKDPTSVFSPRIEIENKYYSDIVTGSDAVELLENAEQTEAEIERLNIERENLAGQHDGLEPWKSMTGPVEHLRELENTTCITGLLPHQYYADTVTSLDELGGVVEEISHTGTMHACVVVCLNEAAGEVQKVLRGGDFEAVSFENMYGSIRDILTDCEEKLAHTKIDLKKAKARAEELAADRLKLQILSDHYVNLLSRENTRTTAPATENVVLLEGWAKQKDYKCIEKIVAGFASSSVDEIELAEGEEVPVEIENHRSVRPFETITRLYGMPAATDMDPTVFLAPFFALFFGLCLTDAGYGLIMLGLLWWAMKKMKGNKGPLWMFVACAVSTVIAGALTGSWFADAIFSFAGEGSGIDNLRTKIMLFDPLKSPLTFFMLSLGLGYIQIQFGLGIAFYNNIRNKDYPAAIFEQLTWLIFLNSLLLYGLSKGGILPAALAKVFGPLAIIQTVLIFLFTERKSGVSGRIGGGVFALFSTVFYFGDILSYVRLMALGMVTAGLGMAVNILVKLMMDIPYVGFILGGILFVGGHIFNLAMSTLSSFVHSLRLQFVEFFPKFLVGGGKDFEPLQKKYQHITVNIQENN